MTKIAPPFSGSGTKRTWCSGIALEEDSSSEESSSEELELETFCEDFALELEEGVSEDSSSEELELPAVSALETASGCEGYFFVGIHSSASMFCFL